jgi:hypothetical protein
LKWPAAATVLNLVGCDTHTLGEAALWRMLDDHGERGLAMAIGLAVLVLPVVIIGATVVAISRSQSSKLDLIKKTHDGGHTWTAVSLPDKGAFFQDPALFGQTVIEPVLTCSASYKSIHIDVSIDDGAHGTSGPATPLPTG